MSENRDVIIAALMEILENGQPDDPEFGLCVNIEEALYNAYYDEDEVLSALAEFVEGLAEWPEGTGCTAYPVPATRGDKCRERAAEAYFASRDTGRWEGEQGELRMDLVNWLLEEFYEV